MPLVTASAIAFEPSAERNFCPGLRAVLISPPILRRASLAVKSTSCCAVLFIIFAVGAVGEVAGMIGTLGAVGGVGAVDEVMADPCGPGVVLTEVGAPTVGPLEVGGPVVGGTVAGVGIVAGAETTDAVGAVDTVAIGAFGGADGGGVTIGCPDATLADVAPVSYSLAKGVTLVALAVDTLEPEVSGGVPGVGET